MAKSEKNLAYTVGTEDIEYQLQTQGQLQWWGLQFIPLINSSQGERLSRTTEDLLLNVYEEMCVHSIMGGLFQS